MAAGAAALAFTLVRAGHAWRGKMEGWTPATLVPHSAAARDYQRRVYPRFAHAWAATRFLHTAGARPGSIYVIGDPLVQMLSGRRQALAINGWSWDMHVERQWRALPGQLAQARPAYLLLSPDYLPYVERNSPETLALLDREYRRRESTEAGVWYELAAP